MDKSDAILMMDQKYSGSGAVSCPNDGKKVKFGQGDYSYITTEHGKLGVHNSGAYLICGACGHQQPISVA